MKILIAADIFPPVGGGPAIYAAGLSNALTEKGDTVTVVSLTVDSKKEVTGATVVAVTQKNKLLRYWEYFGLLLKHARQADLVYAMGPVNAGLPALFAARLLGKKFVVKVVGDYAWEQGFQRFGVTELIDEFQTKKYSGSVRRLQVIQKFVTRSADQVIVPSEYLKKLVIGWGVLFDKVAVIYNAVSFLAPEPKYLGQKQQAGETWILTVARLVPWKGIDTIIRLLPRLKSELPNQIIRYKIIGDGPDRQRLQDLVEKNNLQGTVELLGELSNTEVMAYTSSADIFVLNSGYEGFSHVLVQALACNKPVAASNVGGNPEIIIPGETGELFPYNDTKEILKTLVTLIRIRPVYNFLQTEQRITFFAKFDFNKMVQETKALLQKICAHS